jgi:dCTP deaminase
MVLSDVEILSALKVGIIKIVPFNKNCLNAAGYDLRLKNTVMIEPGVQELVSTIERIELDFSVVGFLNIRSSFAREGVIGSLALVDPGFRGQLTIALFNASRQRVKIKKCERFVQVTFAKLGGRAKRGYIGRYQDSEGVVKSLRWGSSIKSRKKAQKML